MPAITQTEKVVDNGDDTYSKVASIGGGGVAAGATDSGSPVKVGGVYNAPVPTYTAGQRADLQTGSRGSLNVSLLTPDSSAPIGVAGSGTDGTTNAATTLAVRGYNVRFNGVSWDRDRKANLVARLVSAAASTNATLVKSTPGDVHKIRGFNANAAARYLKLYNKATAPTVGTDVPFMTIYLPATSSFEVNLDGLYFSLGIGFGLTTAAADADVGALTAADVLALNITYA